jgi:hypothetical protein
MLRRVVVEIIAGCECASRIAVIAILLALSALPLEAAHADPAPTLLWRLQANLGAYGYVSALAADAAGNVVVAGPTVGAFGGPNKGGGDVFVAVYAPDGTPRWRRHPGTRGEDGEPRVATGGAGNVVVAGSTTGSLAQSNNGSTDAFVVNYAGDRTLRWRRQAGTRRSEIVSQVAIDTAGNVVVAGDTYGSLAGPKKGFVDAFVIKYASDGTEQWRRQLGTTGQDGAAGIATDAAGDIVVAGWTAGSLGGPNEGNLDAFIVKYASDGTERWRRQLGSTVSDLVAAVAINDAGDIVIAGYTPGSLGGPNNGGLDVFAAAYSSDGTPLWTRQLGTTVDDWAYGVAIDAAAGNVILGWKTNDAQIGELAFFTVYSASGTLLGTQPLPRSPDDEYTAVFAIDGAGNVYTAGMFPSQSSEDASFFVAKYAPLSP